MILVITLALLLTGSMYAQYNQVDTIVNHNTKTAFGFLGGLNISQISGADAYRSRDTNLGVHVGLLMQIPLKQSLLFQPELLYTQKGYSFQYINDAGNDVKTDDRYAYAEIPLLFKLNVPIDEVRIQPYAGMSLGLLLSAKSKRTTTITNNTVTQSYDVKEHMSAIDMGLVLGADVVVMERIILGGSYNFGLLNINKDSMPDIGTKVHNGVFMLSVGYLFN